MWADTHQKPADCLEGAAQVGPLTMSAQPLPVSKRLGLPSVFSLRVGKQQYVLEQHGLSADGKVHSGRALAGAFRPTAFYS